MLKDKVSLAPSSSDRAVGDNYDRLSYGLCVFCSLDECQNEFEDYLEEKNAAAAGEEGDEFVVTSKDLTKRFTLPAMTNFTTVEEYAHLGVTKDQCLAGSLLVLVPFVYLILWQVHFLLVAKTYNEAGKFANKRRQIANWRRASSEMHRAGLSHAGIDNPRELREIVEAAAEAVQLESVENDFDSSNRQLNAPSEEDSNRNMVIDNYPSIQSGGLHYTSQLAGYGSGHRSNRLHYTSSVPTLPPLTTASSVLESTRIRPNAGGSSGLSIN